MPRDTSAPVAQRLVHVVESLDVGGLERMVLSLAAWQAARGAAVRIICLFHEGAWAGEARARGLDVVGIGKQRGLDLHALRRLRIALRPWRPDVLHTHNAVAHYYTAAASLGLDRARMVNTRHGMGEAGGGRRLDALYRLSMRRADVAVAVCQAACRRFVATGAFAPAKAAVVRNAADIARAPVRNAAARERLLMSLGRPSHAMVVGAVGRLSAIKNHALLLRAARLVRQRGQAIELVIVGDGPERASLQSMATALQIGDCVHLVGWRDDVASLLAGFDVLAMPSRSEGYSLAMVEAAAAALPLVATAVGGNPEIVQQGKTGLLVPDDDAPALADALARLASDVGLRERLGDAARQWALAHAGLDAMGHAYAALYEGRR